MFDTALWKWITILKELWFYFFFFSQWLNLNILFSWWIIADFVHIQPLTLGSYLESMTVVIIRDKTSQTLRISNIQTFFVNTITNTIMYIMHHTTVRCYVKLRSHIINIRTLKHSSQRSCILYVGRKCTKRAEERGHRGGSGKQQREEQRRGKRSPGLTREDMQQRYQEPTQWWWNGPVWLEVMSAFLEAFILELYPGVLLSR